MNTSLSDLLEGPLVNGEEVAVLLDVTVAELRACIGAQRMVDVGTQHVQLPAAWIAQAQRRAAIYQAVTGRDDMAGAIEFWKRETFIDSLAGAGVMGTDKRASVHAGDARTRVMGDDLTHATLTDKDKRSVHVAAARARVKGNGDGPTGHKASPSRIGEPRAQTRHGRQFRPPPEGAEREFLRSGLGAELRELRLARGLSQRALAEQAGCAPQTPGRIELGQRRTRRSMLESLARVLMPEDVQALTDRLVELAGESLAPEIGKTVRWRSKRARRALQHGLRLDIDPDAPLPSDPAERRAALRREIDYLRAKLAEHRLRSRILTPDNQPLPAVRPSNEDTNPEGEGQ